MQNSAVLFDEKEKLWHTSNYPHGDFINQTIGEAFLEKMRSIDGAKVLEYYFDDAKQRTAAEIYQEAVTVAHNLQKLGIKQGDVVVLYSLNNPKITPLVFGCYLIGAIVNFFETKMEPKHVDYTLELLAPALILFEEQSRSNVIESLQRAPLLSLKLLLSIDDPAAPNVETELLRPISIAEISKFKSVELDDPKTHTAALLLTSGSTGVPKVVKLSHAGLLHGLMVWWWDPSNHAEIDVDSVLFSFSPLRWISQIAMMYQSVLLGVKRVCAVGPPTGTYGVQILTQTQITHLFVTPPLFNDILQATVNEFDGIHLKSLKFVQLGGEQPSEALINQARISAPNCKVFRCYGMTEMGGCITNDEFINGGQITPGLRMKVLDTELNPVGPNVRGQFCLKAPVPFLGYHKIDNAKYFVQNGFFLNGDYGFFDEHNNLHMEARYASLVRAKNTILIPYIVEALINAAVEEIAAVRLVGYKNSQLDADDIGALFVIIKPSATKSIDDIRNAIRDRLKNKLTISEYQIIQSIYFVERYPLTTCGKIDISALKYQAMQLK